MRAPRVWALVLVCVPLLMPPVRAGEETPEPAFEVLVVGTFHAPWQFRSRHFHPGHVRAALEAAKADVVGVESNPTWFAKGVFHDVTYEAQEVAVPWAKAKGIPVYGIDWMYVEAWEKTTAEGEKRRAARLQNAAPSRWMFGEQAGTALVRTTTYFRETAVEADFRHVNDIGSKAYGEKWLTGASRGPVFGGRRNQEIAKRCVEVMKDHPGRRLVVVIGAGHKAVLDEIFRRREDVRLLEWETDVPAPTEAVAAAALTQTDRLLILGHNLDGERSYFHPELIDLDRMEEVLDAYRGAGGHPRIVAYFAARFMAMRGDDPRAQLAALVAGDATGDPDPYPFPLDHWRMGYTLAQAARLEYGQALLAAGEREPARALLEALAASMPEPSGTQGPDWRRLTLAKARPAFLLAADADPREPWARAWQASDPGYQRQALTWDAEIGALRMEVTHPQGAGQPYLALNVPVSASEYRFTGRVRARNVDRVSIEVYVWPDGIRAQTIARHSFAPSGGEWEVIDLAWSVPAGCETLGVNVYAARTADGTLWLDDARVEPAR